MTRKILETERLVLRRMEMSDIDDLMGIFSDPVAMRYYPATKSRQEVEGWVRWTLGSYEDHGFGLWVAILKDSGEFAGQCGLTVQEVEGERRGRDRLPLPEKILGPRARHRSGDGGQGPRLPNARLPAARLPDRSW